MRLAGNLTTELQARLFGDYLFTVSIENRVRPEEDGSWGVWVVEESHLGRAMGLLQEFAANPNDPKYVSAVASARTMRTEQVRRDATATRRMRPRVAPMPSQHALGMATVVVIGISVVVFLLGQASGGGGHYPSFLFISNPVAGGLGGLLPEVRNGQIWRLVTPIFLHFGFMHIVFNMLWLSDLGRMVESARGPRFLLIFIAVLAVFSNLGQYFVSGPAFGGMSGVVYGLLGYIWMKGKFDPGSGMFLHSTTVTMMMIWLVLCFTGLLGPVANTAHAVGLVGGVAWGYLTSQRVIRR